MPTPNPWSTVTGATSPPPWQGVSTVHRMPDDEERKREAVEKEAPPDPSLIARRPASRIVCQFSCGAASAVATKLALAQRGETVRC